MTRVPDADRSAVDHERALAEFAAGLSLADVPEAVRETAGLTIADTLAACIAGWESAELAELRDRWASSGPGSVPVIGTASTAMPDRAAYLAGASTTALELDPGHKRAGGHPASYVLPVLFAEATGNGATVDCAGGRVLTAFVAGYEAATRAGIATGELDGTHPHAAWGGVGAAAGLANLRGYTPEQTLTAMRIAASAASVAPVETSFAGVANTLGGRPNAAGWRSVEEVAAGFDGLDAGIARSLEALGGSAIETGALSAGLGEQWELDRGYVKPHAACRFTHAAIDAVLAMRDRESFDPAAITDITVETSPVAAGLDDPRPTTSLGAKFSIPVAVASVLSHGRSDQPAFRADALTDEVYRIADRVSVTRTAPSTLPEDRGARVEIRLADRRLRETVASPRGGPDRPLTRRERREKFDRLVTPRVGTERASELWQCALHPADTTSGTIVSLTRPPRSAQGE